MPTRRSPTPLLLGALLLLLPLAAAGCALVESSPARRIMGPPPPTVGYRATQVMEINGRRYTGEVYAMPGVKRLEMPTAGDQTVVSVVRYDEGMTVSWLGDTEIAGEMPVGHFGVDLRSPNHVAFDSEAVGPDRVDGFEATKYAYTATALGGAVSEGAFWLTPENIVVRLEAVQTTPDAGDPRWVVMTLEDLQIGPQDPSLFEPPPGATFTPLPDLRGYDGFLKNLFGI